MSTILKDNSEFIAQQYAKAFKTLDVEPIAFLLNDAIRHKFQLNGVRDMSIYNEQRYLGYLYQTFHKLKKQGITIKAELTTLDFENIKRFCLVMQPPHSVDVIYPMQYEYEGYDKNRVQHFADNSEMIFMLKTNNGNITRIFSSDIYSTTDGLYATQIGKLNFV